MAFDWRPSHDRSLYQDRPDRDRRRLIYLCVVMTAFPAAQAQSSARPGEPTGPRMWSWWDGARRRRCRSLPQLPCP